MRALMVERKSVPCGDCGHRFPPYVMDFDHVRGAKVSDVSAMARDGRPYEVVLAEIEKCDVVCANCHRIRTHDREVGKKVTPQ